MRPRSIDQQIAALRPAVRSGLAGRFHVWLLACAAGCSLIAVVMWHPVPLMVAAFLAIVGLSERRAGPNIVAALSAYETQTHSSGEVTISTTTGSDEVHYHARVEEPGQSAWSYEFIPQGWTPEPGRYPARIWRDSVSSSIVLATIDGGLLIPRYAPQPAEPSDRHSQPG
ncbi:hypothetical protein [Elongatibacter sediminis]|uniref:Uncharacterized protein n=1 Tax=Elongatibacter sediminis TaxID=3119006 RepID=A0AAW9RFQ9_9GAMM